MTALRYPKYCVAGAFWIPTYPLLTSLVLTFRGTPAPSRAHVDLKIARQIAGPIGARDSFTYKYLRDAGIDAVYSGCPTLFLDAANALDDGYVLVSLGRSNLKAQISAARRFSRSGREVQIVCHEPPEYEKARRLGWDGPLHRYDGDVGRYLSLFERAQVVVTGRLHGVLPSLAFGKRVFYSGTSDTRLTLLSDLGVRIHSIADIDRGLDLASDEFSQPVAASFRSAQVLLLRGIEERHRTPPSD
jgi:hypothetical protein